jgi:SRSO17 transposase
MLTPLDPAPPAEPLIAGLDALHARIADRFARAEARHRARRYLAGLLGPVERKNGWQLAEYLAEPGPQGVQRLLNAADWDADAVRDDLRAYVIEHLGDDDGILLVDETGFLKKGTKSAGVARQYSGTAGRRENQQIGVFVAYASRHGCAFLDRALYLPEVWAADAPRRAEAGIPPEVAFATKPELARAMLGRAFGADVPARWVAGDTVYGHDELRRWLEEEGRSYVLAVACTHLIWTAGNQVDVQGVAATLPDDAWARLSAGEGSQGPRWYDWACLRLPYESRAGMAHWLLIRRDLTDRTELAYYRVYGPEGTSVQEMVRVGGMRWAIEGALEQAKGEVGLDQYEVRRWEAWRRHITLALLAHAFLEVTRLRNSAGTTGKGEALPSVSPSPCPRSAGCLG